jgi:hypothetical protein
MAMQAHRGSLTHGEQSAHAAGDGRATPSATVVPPVEGPTGASWNRRYFMSRAHNMHLGLEIGRR